MLNLRDLNKFQIFMLHKFFESQLEVFNEFLKANLIVFVLNYFKTLIKNFL